MLDAHFFSVWCRSTTGSMTSQAPGKVAATTNLHRAITDTTATTTTTGATSAASAAAATTTVCQGNSIQHRLATLLILPTLRF
eukprot:12519-Heterococcus_DN1.PRE.1